VNGSAGNDYQKALSEVLSHTSTEWAPWHVIPADRKWFGRIGAAAVLVHALMKIDPRFPPVSKQQHQALREVKEALEAQAPRGAAPDPFERDREAKAGEVERREDRSASPSVGAPDLADEPQAASKT
jgi:hypothetical protein